MNAWGNELKKGDYVVQHIHDCYHCILYLTEGEPLILPELNMKITFRRDLEKIERIIKDNDIKL